MVDVSIIMPIYNVEKHLEKAIKSALNQTYKNIELILINDGSPDNSIQICRRYEKIDNRVYIIDQKNTGVSYARNAGLAKATGNYIYFIDSDDYIETDLIEDNLKIAKETAADLVVFGFIEEITSQDGSTTKKTNIPKLKPSRTKEQFRDNFSAYHSFTPYALWNKLYKRQYLIENNVRFMNQTIGEDALFNLQAYRHLEKVEVNPKAYYHYVFRPNSAVNHYIKDRFDQEYKVAYCFEQLMKKWDKSDQFQELINREYWNTIYLELKNLSSKECPLKQKEKIKIVKNIMQDKKLKETVENLTNQKEENKFVKALLFLVKNKSYSLALNLMELRINLGERSRNLLNVMKRMEHKRGV